MSGLAIVVIVGVCLLPGCAGVGEAERVRAHAESLREALAADAEAWRTRAESLPDGDPLREAARSRQEASEAGRAVVEAALSSLDRAIAEAKHPEDPLARVVGAWVPEPARVPALLGLAAAGAFVRAWRLKAGLGSVARGIDAAMREDEEFRACFRRHADTFRATQTPTAKRIVDEATRPGLMVRLPV